MKFTEEKKEAIRQYILEKIDQSAENLVKHVSESLDLNDSTVHRYLQEMQRNGLIRRVKRGEYQLVKNRWEHILRRSSGELDSDLYAFTAYLKPHLQSFEANVQAIWGYVISEMVNNIIDHSEAEQAIMTIEQDALHTTVMLQDNGIGIFRKICDHFHFVSADDAILELLKGKLTTDAKHHSGEGIFFSSRMMDRFFIISEGAVFSCNTFDEDRMFKLPPGSGRGTMIWMSLANNSKKTPQSIFDQYADISGGFTRTAIPLHQVFDSPPVSRSQAKRLEYRLEEFEEITLDFAGLEWMGQGFAHQLFVVFAGEHPNIRLNPVNMVPAVEKMYYHVIA